MNREWQPVGRVPAGGAVLQFVGDPNEVAWAASPAGLFRAVEGSWSSMQRSLPLAQVGAVLARQRYVLAAGLQGGAFYSLDGGNSWQPSRIEQTSAPIGCLAASPNFRQDGILLAGTQGDGVLRSNDSGRTWMLANFGLHNFTIINLAAAPTWGRKEWVFAGTADGVYLSPNGGRAWKSCGLQGKVILSLAVSPSFDQDRLLLAGAEDGLYQSQDGDMNWASVDLKLIAPPTVNAVWFSQDGRGWLGTSEQGIWRSSDGGVTWNALENSPSEVLCLGGGLEKMCAGTFEQGLFSSTDDGASWNVEDGLSARRFQWLAAIPEQVNAPPSAAKKNFLAGGMLEGFWLAANGGRDWQPVIQFDEDGPPLCMAVDANGLWVGGSNGVWKADRLGEPFLLSLQAGEAIIGLACAGDKVWAGGVDGRLWVALDGGQHWQEVDFPGAGAALLALAAEGQELLITVRDAGQRQTQIWRGQSAAGQLETMKWELWLAESTSWDSVQMTHGGLGTGMWVVALGSILYLGSPDGKRLVELPQMDMPPHALVWLPQAEVWLAAAGEALWISPDLTTWQTVETNLPVAEVVAFHAIQTGASALAALTVDGRLWQWRQ